MWEVLAPAIVISIMALTAGVTLVLRGPLGKALAERIAGRVVERHDDREWEALRAEVDDLRGQFAEMQERIDFTERLLAQQRDAGHLPRGT